ncbi:MBL fold metallo-hydrolase [Ruminococcus sp.]|uniref:MBL fold metallo-hydrolase n=1 Tax=Ruminococcus sp. TaxID=41978 RepID=UPI0025E32F5F|nr:MBL fold metallo-hydrolase [Ruminococcus sp.]MBO4523748.1 MBL fold metallo-hydrolase [Ruminococcus sp.]
MARLYPLFSSSKGNSTFIGTEKGGILIDCGVSFKRLSDALETNNIPLSAVQGVFITHEHSDHVSGLAMLTKKTGIPVYGQKRTLQRLCDENKIAASSHVIDITGKTISCGGSELSCFNTPHDTIQSCGYRVHTSDDKYCAVCTDLGHVTSEVNEALTGCRMVLIEANYDDYMLRTGPYPLYLKERILSQNGHLSNDDCAVQVGKLIECGTTHILLGHLSQDNNHPRIADEAVQRGLACFTRGKDYLMGVAPVETTGGAVIF